MSTAARSLLSRTTTRIADGVARKSTSSRSTSFALSRVLSSSHKNQPSSFFQRCTIHQPTKYSSSLLTGNSFSTAVSPDLDDAQEDSKKAELIRRIKADLIEADVNKDGRLDADELKLILKKYSDTFTDEDVIKLGNLFYVGKGGDSVSHERFVEAVAEVTTNRTIEDESGLKHRRMNMDSNHPLGLGNCSAEYLGQDTRVYTDDELDIKLTHVPPVTFIDKVAYFGVRVIRLCFDTVSLWNFGEITQKKVFRRVIFLETVAAIPGFVAAMVRHFKSLRTFSRDGGMMQMFLDEANNERMHLLTFVRMKNPSYLARALVLVSQTVVGAGFFIVYNISPNLCHRFVGYVEEEACHTYTDIIKCIEEAPEGNEMANWRTEKAPAIARGYWRLGEEGTVLDMMYAIRADEAEHRDVNHECSGMKEGQINPLYNPQEKFDEMLMQYAQTIMKRDTK